jgi:hypothetical protein
MLGEITLLLAIFRQSLSPGVGEAIFFANELGGLLIFLPG